MNPLDTFSAFLIVLLAIAITIIFHHQLARIRSRKNAPSFCARQEDIGCAPSAKLSPVSLPVSHFVLRTDKRQ